MTTIVFNKLATIVKLQPKHKLPFNRVEHPAGGGTF